VRLPAQEIEDLILAELTRLLGSQQQLLDLLSDSCASESDRQRLLEGIQSPRDLKGTSHAELQSLLHRVLVHDDSIEVQVRKGALLKLVLGVDLTMEADGPEGASPGHITLRVEAQLKRCGGEVRFLLPPDSSHAKPHPVPSLIRAIARAHDWVDRIRSGDVHNQRALAAETGLDERYIGSILPLAFLAPDLTEAILEGRQPSSLDLGRCLKPLPPDWKEQRAALSTA
jgi:hypothetical protein